MTKASSHLLCSTQDIPEGKMKRFQLEGKYLLVCHVKDNFYCVDDMCTHEDASLYLGCLKGDEIQCSLHGGRFSVVTGEATVEPAEIPLKTYEVSIDDKQLFVDLGVGND